MQQQRGFTLIELIIVMVVLGVLAVFAAPRILNRSDFDARGFHDTTLAYLRYAQKTAIAQRRTVCVSFTASSIALRIANTAAVYDCSGGNGLALTGPDGKASGSANAATYSGATPAAFGFDALGQPVDTSGATLAQATIAVTAAGKTITVETITGYVHE